MKKFNLLLHPDTNKEIEKVVQDSPIITSKADLVRRAIEYYIEKNYSKISERIEK